MSSLLVLLPVAKTESVTVASWQANVKSSHIETGDYGCKQ